MTLEELRRKPIGILEKRCIEIDGVQVDYYLGRLTDNRYFIGCSEDESYCSRVFGESTMLTILNDRQSSDNEAIEIYVTDPHLSPD